jgi:hypothetical protein
VATANPAGRGCAHEGDSKQGFFKDSSGKTRNVNVVMRDEASAGMASTGTTMARSDSSYVHDACSTLSKR